LNCSMFYANLLLVSCFPVLVSEATQIFLLLPGRNKARCCRIPEPPDFAEFLVEEKGETWMAENKASETLNELAQAITTQAQTQNEQASAAAAQSGASNKEKTSRNREHKIGRYGKKKQIEEISALLPAAGGDKLSALLQINQQTRKDVYFLNRRRFRRFLWLAVPVCIFGIALLVGALFFLIGEFPEPAAQLDSILTASAEQEKELLTILSPDPGLLLKAALIPAVSGLILILASLHAALRVHKKSAELLEYYQRCLEEERRVLLSAELLEKFSASDRAGAIPSRNDALAKIIESQMELNKRDMGPADED